MFFLQNYIHWLNLDGKFVLLFTKTRTHTHTHTDIHTPILKQPVEQLQDHSLLLVVFGIEQLVVCTLLCIFSAFVLYIVRCNLLLRSIFASRQCPYPLPRRTHDSHTRTCAQTYVSAYVSGMFTIQLYFQMVSTFDDDGVAPQGISHQTTTVVERASCESYVCTRPYLRVVVVNI